MNIVVPIDLMQEEKEILAILSKRQFFIILPAFVVGMGNLVVGNIPFVSGGIDFAIRLVFFIFLMGSAISLSFIKLDKFDQYLSEFLRTLIKYRRSQKTFYHWP